MKIYKYIIFHFCGQLDKVNSDTKSTYKNIIVKIISQLSLTECRDTFGSKLDDIAEYFDETSTEHNFFACLAAGQMEYLKNISKWDEKKIVLHLLNTYYNEELKKLGINIKTRHFKNNEILESFLEKNFNLFNNMKIFLILSGIVKDYNITRSDFIEKILSFLDKSLPSSKLALVEFVDYVETLDMEFDGVANIKKTLEDMSLAADGGRSANLRKQAYNETRSPRADRSKRVKSLKFSH